MALIRNNLVGEFINGALGGSNTGSLAGVLGEVAGLIVPEVRAVGTAVDFWGGLRDRDASRMVGAMGMMAGAEATGALAKAASTELKAGSMLLTQALLSSARRNDPQALKDPKLKDKIEQAQVRAFQQIALHAVGQLSTGWDSSVREHKSFSDAQKSMFAAFGVKPDPDWFKVLDPDTKAIIGKHKIEPGPDGDLNQLLSTLGFRFVAPEKSGDPERVTDKHGLVWWKQPKADEKPEVGVETFPASAQEWAAIATAYLNQTRKFGRAKPTVATNP